MTRIVYLHRAELDAADLAAGDRAYILDGYYAIWNAPRPLPALGFEGPFHHGIYYACAAPGSQAAARCVDLDGWPVCIVDDAAIMRLTAAEIENVIRDEGLALHSEMVAELRRVGSDLWNEYREKLELPSLAGGVNA